MENHFQSDSTCVAQTFEKTEMQLLQTENTHQNSTGSTQLQGATIMSKKSSSEFPLLRAHAGG